MINNDNKLARMLERVRALLARADHPNTPKPEADVSREQAEKLIEKYRIAEQELLDSGQVSLEPSWRDIVFAERWSEFRSEYSYLAQAVANHMDLSFFINVSESGWVINAVGYESDLSIFDLLLTECISAFGANLEPKFDPSETEAENAYRLRKGGWERKRISEALYGLPPTEATMKARNRRVTKMIKAECERHGTDPSHLLGQGNDISLYRKTFASAFCREINSRLRRMSAIRSEAGSMVMLNRKETLREALYTRYPNLRPVARTADLDGPDTYVPQGKCPKCKKAKSGYCRDHAMYRPLKAKPTRFSASGYEMGVSAAQSVNLGGQGRIS